MVLGKYVNEEMTKDNIVLEEIDKGCQYCKQPYLYPETKICKFNCEQEITEYNKKDELMRWFMSSPICLLCFQIMSSELWLHNECWNKWNRQIRFFREKEPLFDEVYNLRYPSLQY